MNTKKLAFSLLTMPPVNMLVRSLIRPFLPMLNSADVVKIPIVGEVAYNFPDGTKLRLFSDGMDKIAGTLYWYGLDGIEGTTIEVFIRLLSSCRTVLDIGANTGIYCVVAGLKAKDCKVYAFEPVPRVFSYLKKNIELNRLPNVKAFECAVTDKVGEIPLYIEAGLRLPLGASTSHVYRADVQKPIMVPAVTVDTFVAEHGLGKIELMKIDTETTEPDVLEGARKTVEKDRPILICEVLPGKPDERLHRFLDPLDYRYFLIADMELLPRTKIVGEALYTNYLFLPAEKASLAETLLPRKS